jgi:hypothetical protein
MIEQGMTEEGSALKECDQSILERDISNRALLWCVVVFVQISAK